MTIRSAEAIWRGDLKTGSGRLKVESQSFDLPYSFSTRFEASQDGTNPEELIGAAHAGCFSMALSKALSDAGYPPKELKTSAKVHLSKENKGGFAIPKIELEVAGEVPNINEDKFIHLAEEAKKNCPVSKLLAGAQISLKARLAG